MADKAFHKCYSSNLYGVPKMSPSTLLEECRVNDNERGSTACEGTFDRLRPADEPVPTVQRYVKKVSPSEKKRKTCSQNTKPLSILSPNGEKNSNGLSCVMLPLTATSDVERNQALSAQNDWFVCAQALGDADQSFKKSKFNEVRVMSKRKHVTDVEGLCEERADKIALECEECIEPSSNTVESKLSNSFRYSHRTVLPAGSRAIFKAKGHDAGSQPLSVKTGALSVQQCYQSLARSWVESAVTHGKKYDLVLKMSQSTHVMRKFKVNNGVVSTVVVPSSNKADVRRYAEDDFDLNRKSTQRQKSLVCNTRANIGEYTSLEADFQSWTTEQYMHKAVTLCSDHGDMVVSSSMPAVDPFVINDGTTKHVTEEKRLMLSPSPTSIFDFSPTPYITAKENHPLNKSQHSERKYGKKAFSYAEKGTLHPYPSGQVSQLFNNEMNEAFDGTSPLEQVHVDDVVEKHILHFLENKDEQQNGDKKDDNTDDHDLLGGRHNRLLPIPRSPSFADLFQW